MPTFTIKTPLRLSPNLDIAQEMEITVDAPDAKSAKTMAVEFLKERQDGFIQYCERNNLNPANELFIEKVFDLQNKGARIRVLDEAAGHAGIVGPFANEWRVAMAAVAQRAAERAEAADPTRKLRKELQFYKTTTLVFAMFCAAFVALIVILS